MPGSHKGPTYDHHSNGFFAGAIDPDTCPLDFSKAARVTGKAGACSFHHVRAVHGSEQNLSGKDRVLLCIRRLQLTLGTYEGSTSRGKSMSPE